MLSARIDQVAATILEHSPQLASEGRSVALATYRLLADGSPVGVDHIAARVHLDATRVESLLSSWPGVFRAEGGPIVGFWGLSTTEFGPHRLYVDGVTLSAWCAWDTLFLPELLEQTAEVRSHSPLDGEPISLRVGAERIEHSSPPSLVVSMVPARESDDFIRTFCHQIHFFASQAEGKRWIAERDGAFLMPLADGFELAKRVNHARYGGALTAGP
jgi:alkylmercury lyase